MVPYGLHNDVALEKLEGKQDYPWTVSTELLQELVDSSSSSHLGVFLEWDLLASNDRL